MAKAFQDALRDGYNHLTESTDQERIKQLRDEGVLVDDEGYHVFSFGPEHQYELTIEPLSEDGQYQIALYKNGITLTEKLPIWSKK